MDLHAHCIFADAPALLGSGVQAAMPPTKGVEERARRWERRLREGVPVAPALARLLDGLRRTPRPWSPALTGVHLVEIGRAVVPGAYAALVLDGAGWHKPGGALRLRDDISLLHLSLCSPELNPVGNVRGPARQQAEQHRV